MRECFPDLAARQAIGCVQILPSQIAAYANLADEVESTAPCIEAHGTDHRRGRGDVPKTEQLIVSGFFGTLQRVLGTVDAAKLLGLETIKALMDASVVFVPDAVLRHQQADLQQLNEHSIAIAGAARQIAETVSTDQALIHDCHMAGMLHDIGALGIALLRADMPRRGWVSGCPLGTARSHRRRGRLPSGTGLLPQSELWTAHCCSRGPCLSGRTGRLVEQCHHCH